MMTQTVLIPAILYAILVFCICSFKKIKSLFVRLFSKGSIKLLRENASARPLPGDLMDDEVRNAMEPMLIAWRDADEKALPARMDKTFLARMQRIIGVLKKHGIRRELRMFSAFTERNDNGKVGFRKWNEGGREWREGIATASVLDLVTEARSGNRVQDCYYPNVKFTVLQSRHIKYEDAKREAKSRKDQFGYMKKKKKEETVFYGESRNLLCKSCGAELEINAQLVTCPYCGSRLFSDFHDWQTEHFSVEPVSEYSLSHALFCTGLAFALSVLVHSVELLVFHPAEYSIVPFLIIAVLTAAAIFSCHSILDTVREKRKKQIVRFSEHQFKQCMYEALWQQFRNLEIVDFFICDILLKDVKNTEETTELTVCAPLYTQVLKDGAVLFEKKKWKGTFTRARYPERLKSKGAVVEERECPSCGGNFIPDDRGCCSFCGYSLRVSNAKWKLKQEK